MTEKSNKKHREKLVISLLAMLILFFCSFTIAIIGLKNGYAIFNLGIGYAVENWMIIILSIIFNIRIIYELIKI